LKTRLEKQCRNLGVDPKRIVVVGAWKSFSRIRELLTYVDIYLDSFPHSGGLSSLDAISLGIPTVTLQGATQRENQTSDLLRALDLESLIASDVDGYIERAGRLAKDPVAWAEVNFVLRTRWSSSSFFDNESYSRDMAKLILELISGQRKVSAA